MPADLMEPPVEEAAIEDLEKSAAQTNKEAPKKSAPPTPKSVWRDIFEGHDEFLGWTPE